MLGLKVTISETIPWMCLGREIRLCSVEGQGGLRVAACGDFPEIRGRWAGGQGSR